MPVFQRVIRQFEERLSAMVTEDELIIPEVYLLNPGSLF